MPGFDDYHAFTSTSGGGSGGSGCSNGCLTWILAGLMILWIIEKLGG